MTSPTRSCLSANAISASAFGCRSLADGTNFSDETSISANRKPKSGWSTPNCCCTASEVRPILRPTMTPPVAVRRLINSCCTAYATSMSWAPIRSRMGATGRRIFAAPSIRSAASTIADVLAIIGFMGSPACLGCGSDGESRDPRRDRLVETVIQFIVAGGRQGGERSDPRTHFVRRSAALRGHLFDAPAIELVQRTLFERLQPDGPYSPV